MMQFLRNNRNRIWYMLCFLALGIIDQRRGSAVGNIQMAAANLTGVIVALLLLPSLRWSAFRRKGKLVQNPYFLWSIFAGVSGILASVWGWNHWEYREPWITGVLNVVVWGYLVIYLVREWKQLAGREKLHNPFYWCVFAMFGWMILSIHDVLLPVWMLVIFGGFYLIGIPGANREDFFQGLLNGIILWFFLQQIVAFGLRPYDYVRYRGMYSGETQSGLFYMIVYCAFLCKWVWAKKKGCTRFWVWSWFFLSAASISFLLLTGGRSSLMGAAVATLLLYTIYDIVWGKSFYRWLGRIALFGVLVALTFPMVYGAVRYLPTILHHPIWFEGEYSEESSVRSYDAWDSDRYITFEEAVDSNIGRILSIVGIDIKKITGENLSSMLTIHALAAEGDLAEDAAERIDPGSSPEHEFRLPDSERGDPVSLRKTIYACYLYHMNWLGHSKEEYGFYLVDGYFSKHAHNMLIQMGYDYGIPAGILFLGFLLYSLFRFLQSAVRDKDDQRWICLTFLGVIFFYGMTEMAVIYGMITWILIYLLLYFASEPVQKSGTIQ